MKWSVKSEEPVVKTFVTKFKETFGKEPEVYAAAGYDCMKIVAEAIRVGGYSSEEIKKALYNIKGYNGVTGTISFDEFGEIEGKYDAFIVKNGNFEPYK